MASTKRQKRWIQRKKKKQSWNVSEKETDEAIKCFFVSSHCCFFLLCSIFFLCTLGWFSLWTIYFCAMVKKRGKKGKKEWKLHAPNTYCPMQRFKIIFLFCYFFTVVILLLLLLLLLVWIPNGLHSFHFLFTTPKDKRKIYLLFSR